MALVRLWWTCRSCSLMPFACNPQDGDGLHAISTSGTTTPLGSLLRHSDFDVSLIYHARDNRRGRCATCAMSCVENRAVRHRCMGYERIAARVMVHENTSRVEAGTTSNVVLHDRRCLRPPPSTALLPRRGSRHLDDVRGRLTFARSSPLVRAQ